MFEEIEVRIRYAGLKLDVLTDESGVQMTPLKDIVGLFGLQWQRQRQRLLASDYYKMRFGIVEVDAKPVESANSGVVDAQKPGQNTGELTHMCEQPEAKSPPPEVFIRLDRVAAYLTTINPERVRAAGNEEGARFLMAKQQEWDDVLHKYESMRATFETKKEHAELVLDRRRATLLKALRVQKEMENERARAIAGCIVNQLSAELGVPYQLELVAANDTAGAQATG